MGEDTDKRRDFTDPAQATTAGVQEVRHRMEEAHQRIERLVETMGRVIIGQETLIRDVVVALLAGGHVLLEGVPGLGKTLLVRTLARALGLSFSRIQFTPDLLPADITGSHLLVEEEGGRRFEFKKGPLFAQIVLADEINRTTPKTQSAMLEAMQEKAVTAGGERFPLKRPFFVLATQNPIEMEGTYPLPEAQLDRFLFKLTVSYPAPTDLAKILVLDDEAGLSETQSVLDAEAIFRLRDLAREILLAPGVTEHAIELLLATQPAGPEAPDVTKRYVQYGASPRGGQALLRAARWYALLDRRVQIGFEDIHQAFLPSMRHRLILNFRGETDGIDVDDILKELLRTA